METPFRISPDIEVLPAHFPIPGAGVLAINAFVIKGREPVLIDTGMGIDSEEFLRTLASVIDPHDLKWIWLTHDDADHTGSLQNVMEAAPHARLAAYSLAVLRLSTAWQVPLERVFWLCPGDSLDLGDRKLTAVRPPLYDNPTTIGVYDDKSAAFFSADCFGAIIPSPVQSTDDLAEAELAQGMTGWASLDNPWVHLIIPAGFKQSLNALRRMGPKQILSSHLPPARGKVEKFLDLLETVPSCTPSIAPNQAVLEQILAGRRA